MSIVGKKMSPYEEVTVLLLYLDQIPPEILWSVLDSFGEHFRSGKSKLDSTAGVRMEIRPWIHMAKEPRDVHPDVQANQEGVIITTFK